MEGRWWKREYLTLLENIDPAQWQLIQVEKEHVLFSTNAGRVLVYTKHLEVNHKKGQEEARDRFCAEQGWRLVPGYYDLYSLPEATNAFAAVTSFTAEKPVWLKKFCFDLEYVDLEEDMEIGGSPL